MTGREITGIRNAAELSKTQLGKLLGKSYRTVLRWEDCVRRPAPLDGPSAMILEMLEAGELPSRYIERARA